MNYKRIYDSLINRAKSRILDGYVEKHHILPRCLGGNDEHSNLVALTPEEHFLAHLLLIKINPNINDLIFAVHRMCTSSNKTKGRKRRKLYGWLKRKHAEAARIRSTGELNSQYGTFWVNNGSISKKLKLGSDIEDGWVKGRFIKFSESTIKKISEAQKKNKTGGKHSAETKQKIKQAAIKRYADR